MNRRLSNSLESEDSGSDWDTTVAESPTHLGPQKQSSTAAFNVNDEYTKVTPKPVLDFTDMEGQSSNGTVNGKSSNSRRKKEISQTTKGGSQLISPPPHLTSFQGALSDYSVVREVIPDIPPRTYEGKGKLYTVPESESFVSPQINLANWDDSDAEERVLKELQKNLVKEKQRYQTISRDRKVMVAGPEKMNISVENQGFVSSPKETRSNESVLEKWPRASEVKNGKGSVQTSDKIQKCILMTRDNDNSSEFLPPSHSVGSTPPMILAKHCTGKKCVFYFEESNPHFVEVEEDGVNAYLPSKVDEMEKLFRRVWREVFAVLRIITSIFILFFAELVLFLAHHIVRPLVLDSITAIGNYVLKPLLALLFNVIIQPIFALQWNIFNAFYQACEPLVKLLGYILTQIAIVVKAFRLFVVQWNTRASGYREEIEII